MCGIAGFYHKNFFSEDDLKKMTDAISHRGPDSSGYYYNNGFGLGHRRLSILDLSAASDQPFYSSCGNYVIVFNGEVYNYKELYQYLDCTPRTTGDTEVILELYIKYGPSFVDKLNGMFAFSILDIRKEEIFICRDRMGVKPVFYYSDENVFVFASELKSFYAIEKIKTKLSVNKRAVNLFMHIGYIPEPDCIYNEIKKFPAGSYGILNSKGLKLQTYWSIENEISSDTEKNFAKAKSTLKEILESSVRYRMISDVPVGTFLSGGIDSSIVTAIAQKQSDRPIKTFSIGFKESKFNESEYAKKVAQYLGTEHYEYILSEKDAQRELELVMEHFDEPFADSSGLPTYMVSRMARQEVKVVLTGDGGDECFMGYGSYQWAQRLSNPMIHLFRKPIGIAFKTFGDNRFKRASSLFDYNNRSTLRSHIFSQEQYFFSESELNRLITPEYLSDVRLQDFFESVERELTPREAQSFFDMKYYLKDDLLTKVDRSSMKCSIEAREPLLDYRLIEFALNLSEELKVNNSISKYLLKEVLYEYIPREYFERPKWGFAIPLVQWLKSDMRYLIEEYISEKVTTQVGILNYSYLENLKKRFFAGEDYLYNRLWLTILLHKWFLKNIG